MMKFLDDEGREGTGVGRKAVLRAHAPRPSMSGAECSCGERFATWEEYGRHVDGLVSTPPETRRRPSRTRWPTTWATPTDGATGTTASNPASATMDCSTADAAGSPRSRTSANGAAHGRRDPGRARRSAEEGIAVDVDPKLQTNRVADLGRTVRPSSRAAGVALLVALAVMSVFGAICAASGHGFDIFALLYILSGQWEFTGAQWALAGLLVILAGTMVGVMFSLIALQAAQSGTAGSCTRSGTS